MVVGGGGVVGSLSAQQLHKPTHTRQTLHVSLSYIYMLLLATIHSVCAPLSLLYSLMHEGSTMSMHS